MFRKFELRVVTHVYNSSILEAKVEQRVKGQPELHSEILLQKSNNK